MPRRVQLMPLQMALIQEMGEPAPGTFGAVMRTLSRRFRGETPKARDAHINRQLLDWAGNNPRTKKPYDIRTAQHWTRSYRAPETEKQKLKKSRNYLEPKGVQLENLLKGAGLDVYVARLKRLEQQGAKVRIRATFDFDGPMGDRPINARHRTIGAHELVEIAPEFWWLQFCAAWREGDVGQGRQLCEDNPARRGACDFFQEAFWDAMGGYSGCAEIYDVEFIEIYEGATAQRRPA